MMSPKETKEDATWKRDPWNRMLHGVTATLVSVVFFLVQSVNDRLARCDAEATAAKEEASRLKIVVMKNHETIIGMDKDIIKNQTEFREMYARILENQKDLKNIIKIVKNGKDGR